MSEHATPFGRTLGGDPRVKCQWCWRVKEFILLTPEGGRVHLCPMCDNLPTAGRAQ